MTQLQFEAIMAWQNETFPKANAMSKAKHLKEEVEELIHELAEPAVTANMPHEIADCLMLIYGCASKLGLNYDDILDALDAKMAINRTRKWGTPDADGVVRHLKTQTPAKPQGLKIYISGPISGLPIEQATANFELWEGRMRLAGYEPINPMKKEDQDKCTTWHEHMRSDIKLLMDCDAIFMMPGSGQSKGAMIEHKLAEQLGIMVLYIGENPCVHSGELLIMADDRHDLQAIAHAQDLANIIHTFDQWLRNKIKHDDNLSEPEQDTLTDLRAYLEELISDHGLSWDASFWQ